MAAATPLEVLEEAVRQPAPQEGTGIPLVAPGRVQGVGMLILWRPPDQRDLDQQLQDLVVAAGVPDTVAAAARSRGA
ncbi:Hypothetical Protein FCC1311_021102 [Hondaea fermentalgiana]|uniref:Uncharacterized protein n=1 Tax=Hondaea fermentalgiana TaxID=2315210 RepID=A0A2R5GCK8_9STRA|nr:Hypothetical Protein FCC1311_021102 [Hondaea fermentalgiana]|eukprot:GBG25891.1 Hypothetical Protein FCC1311_021102 [Hondaea fermentalgiana]